VRTYIAKALAAATVPDAHTDCRKEMRAMFSGHTRRHYVADVFTRVE